MHDDRQEQRMSAMEKVEIPHTRVAVIGAGLSGVAAAVALAQEGADFVVFERAADVGGVWRDNTYPGVACDIPSHLYSYSYAPNAEWSRTFADGGQIGAYIRAVASEHGVLERFRFGQELLDASWDDERQRWSISTTDLALTADLLVDAAGPLTEPQFPEIPGLEGFPGKVFHSARWDHQHVLENERVAVVGTGASAIQFVPEIQPDVAHLTLFQRTAGWVIPRFDRNTTAFERRLLALIPGATRVLRSMQYGVRDGLHYRLIRRNRVFRKITEAVARIHLRRHVPDPELRAKLTPDFEVACKRILISNTWHRALAQPNVDVIASGVREVRGSTVVASDGSECEVDTIILGTGFEVVPPPVTERIFGRGRQSLADTWRSGLQHYRAVEIAGFPNYFRLAGVGCGLGHGSLIFMIEAQTAYLIEALRAMRAHGAVSVEVSEDAQGEYMDFLLADLDHTVWMRGGCQSWYQDASGAAASMWPRSMWSYRKLMRSFVPADHHLRTAAPAAIPAFAV
jgi:cation diffusion facilitator CzcD-associated flavoprotein CzcO